MSPERMAARKAAVACLENASYDLGTWDGLRGDQQERQRRLKEHQEAESALLALLAEPEPVSEAEVEAGAKALWERRGAHADMWYALAENYRDMARKVLAAARTAREGSST